MKKLVTRCLFAFIMVPLLVFSGSDAVAQIVFEEKFSVGELDEPVEELFGANVTAVVSSTGMLYAGDSETGIIRLFDSGGSYVRSAGGRGRGPGEFLSISRMVIAPSVDSLYVLDAQQRRISVWTIPDLAYQRSASYELNGHAVFDFARLPEGQFALFGAEYEGNEVVHICEQNGTHVRSVAPLLNIDDPYLDKNPMGRSQAGISYGTPLRNGDVIVATAAPYTIARVSPDGDIVWRVSDPTLEKPWEDHIIATPDRFQVKPYPQIVSVTPFSETHVLVYVTEARPSREGGQGLCDVWDVSRGERISRQTCDPDAPIIDLAPAEDRTGWGVRKVMDPFPVLVVTKYTTKTKSNNEKGTASSR